MASIVRMAAASASATVLIARTAAASASATVLIARMAAASACIAPSARNAKMVVYSKHEGCKHGPLCARREIPLWSPRRIPHILNVHSEKDSTHSQDTAAPLAHKVPLHLEQQNAVTLVKCRYNSRPKEMSSENVSSAQGSLSMIAHTAKQLTLVPTRRGRQDPMPSSTHLAAARSAMWPQHVQDVGTECVHVALALLALAFQPRPPS